MAHEAATAGTLRERGNARLQAGDVAGAVEAYEAARDLDATCHLTLSNLSLAQLKSGDPAQATKTALECLEHAPEDFVKGWLRLGRAAKAFGDLDLAQEALNGAASRCATDGDCEHVRRIAKSLGLVDVVPDPAVREALAELHRAQEAKREASDRLQKAQASISRQEVADLDRKRQDLAQALHSAAVTTASATDASSGRAASAEQPPPAAQIGPLSSFQAMLDVERASDECDTLLVDFEIAGSLTREGPTPAPDRSGDFIGLYESKQTDPEEYWNMETALDCKARSGSIRMKRPRQQGHFEFRYMADGGRRCAGRSQGVFVSAAPDFAVSIAHKDSPPPFMLLKEPNLLCYWLYMPLGEVAEEARKKKVDLSGTHLPAKLMTATPDPRIPTMTIDEKIRVRIFAPAKARQLDTTGTPKAHLVPYLNLAVDEQVDLDRSTLSFHNGDFLAARLAFSNMFTAANARQQRMLLHPAPVELDAAVYADGIACRSCGAQLAGPLVHVSQSPLMPWTEMLEHLTCVPPEAYTSSDPQGTARPFRAEAVTAKPGVVLLDDAHFDICRQDLRLDALQLCEELRDVKEALDDASRAGDHLLRRAFECRACAAWLGEAVVPEQAPEDKTAVGLDRLQEARFYKHCTQTRATPAFSTYEDGAGSIIGARLSRLSESHEVRTVVVRAAEPAEASATGKSARLLRLQLWTADSWIRTQHLGTEMVPVLKVTYRTQRVDEGVDAHFGVLHVTRAQFENLAASLARSNAWLPPSARVLREDVDERFGFLIW